MSDRLTGWGAGPLSTDECDAYTNADKVAANYDDGCKHAGLAVGDLCEWDHDPSGDCPAADINNCPNISPDADLYKIVHIS